MYKSTLKGHTSPETAYIVEDYPYGLRLRCKIRYWLETKKGFGQRLVSQTTNPKRPGEVWNKSKAGTYNVVAVMILDEQDHIQIETLRSCGWDSEQVISAFETRHAAALGEYERAAIRYIRASAKANERIKTTITVNPGPECVSQTPDEQRAVYAAALRAGYAEVIAEGK